MKVTGTIQSLGKQLLTQRKSNKGRCFLRSRQSLERVYSEGQKMIFFFNGGRYVRVLSAGSQDNYQEAT